MRTLNILIGAAFIFIVPPLLAQTTQPTTQPTAVPAPVLPDLSADVNILANGQVFQKGKLYMSKNGVRMDMGIPTGGTMTNIQRIDKGLMYMLMPNKMYMEHPLPFNPMIKREVPAGWSQTCGDGEAIDNHPTEKCVMTGDILGKPSTTTIWKAKDLGGVVIRTLGDQSGGMELKNVLLGPQPAALFEPPADYRKMEIPAQMKDLMNNRMPRQ